MSPDDPRHGTRAGYQAHRQDGEDACPACLRGRSREDKALRYDHHRGVRIDYAATEVAALIEPWLALGFSYTAIGAAADLGATHGTRLGERIAAGGIFRRRTYLALASLAEESFSPNATVWADLTRTRVFSLMAAGHRLADMPIHDTGKWRTTPTITVTLAARIRDYYDTHQHLDGKSAYTRTTARRAGHRPPAAWDDPGTLAWPLGWTFSIDRGDVVDEVAVHRILSGDWKAKANKAERIEVVRRWLASGRSVNELARLTGWKVERYYTPSTQDQEVA